MHIRHLLLAGAVVCGGMAALTGVSSADSGGQPNIEHCTDGHGQDGEHGNCTPDDSVPPSSEVSTPPSSTVDSSVPDSTPPVSDSVPPPDSSVPPPDSSVPPPDSSVPPPDSSVPPPTPPTVVDTTVPPSVVTSAPPSTPAPTDAVSTDAPTTAAPNTPGQLPTTGSSALPITLGALALVLGGAWIVLQTRSASPA